MLKFIPLKQIKSRGEIGQNDQCQYPECFIVETGPYHIYQDNDPEDQQ